MKKILIVLLVALLLALCLFGCNSDSDATNDVGQNTEAQGEPLYNGENIFHRENGSLEKIVKYENGKILWIREYDENGDYIRYTEYTAYGHFVEYKAHGALTEKVTYYDTHSNITEWITYQYHENGITLKETFYSESGDVKGICEYDKDGVAVKTHIYQKDGNNYLLSEIVEFTYDANGKPLKDLYYSDDGSLFCEVEYNQKGNTVKSTSYGKSGELTGYTLYEYSENQTKLREIYYDSLQNISSICEYRKDGTKCKLTNYFENGRPSLVYEYGENAQIKRIEKYDTDGCFSSIEEFDEDGIRLKYTTFNTDRTTLVYDGNYNIIEGIRYLHQASGTLIRYEYLEGKVRAESFFEDGVNISYSISYDALGNKTSDIQYGSGASVKSRTLYRYDELGSLLSYTVYEPNGTTITYGSEGNIVSGVKYVYIKEQLYQKLEYKNGARSKETLYLDKCVILVSEYDENDTLRKENFYSSGKISRVREYDANGVLRKVTLYNSRGKTTSVIRYDEKGNKI